MEQQIRDILCDAKRNEAFVAEVYRYYRHRGYGNVVLAQVLGMAQSVFVGAVFFVLARCVDYDYLLGGPAAAPSLARDPLAPHGWLEVPLALALAATALSLLAALLGLLRELPALRRVRYFYTAMLGISPAALQTVSWPAVVSRFAAKQFAFTTEPTEPGEMRFYDEPLIMALITRKENLVTVLHNQRYLALYDPLVAACGREWTNITPYIDTAVRDVFFANLRFLPWIRRKGSVDADNIYANEDQWKRQFTARCRWYAVYLFLVGPVTAFTTLFNIIVSSIDIIRTEPSAVFHRQWTQEAVWLFRGLSEAPHLYEARLRLAVDPARKYFDQFPSSMLVNILANFCSFVFGTILCILVVLSLISENFVFEVFSLTSVTWMTILTVAVLTLHSFVKQENLTRVHRKYLNKTARETWFKPEAWKNNEAGEAARTGMESLFKHQLFCWLLEVYSVFQAPYVIGISLPRSRDRIADTCNQCGWNNQAFRNFPNKILAATMFGISPNVDSYTLLDVNGKRDQSYGTSMVLYHHKLRMSLTSFRLNYREWRKKEEREPSEWYHDARTLTKIYNMPAGAENAVDSDDDDGYDPELVRDEMRHFYDDILNNSFPEERKAPTKCRVRRPESVSLEDGGESLAVSGTHYEMSNEYNERNTMLSGVDDSMMSLL